MGGVRGASNATQEKHAGRERKSDRPKKSQTVCFLPGIQNSVSSLSRLPSTAVSFSLQTGPSSPSSIPWQDKKSKPQRYSSRAYTRTNDLRRGFAARPVTNQSISRGVPVVADETSNAEKTGRNKIGADLTGGGSTFCQKPRHTRDKSI